MFHQMKQPPAPYTLFHHQLTYIFHPIPKFNIFFHQILLQNHWSIKHRRYQHTFDVKKQVLSILIGWFFCFCYELLRQLRRTLSSETSVVKCRELLVKKISQRKKGSYCQFFKIFFCFFFVLIHYGIDVYALVSC